MEKLKPGDVVEFKTGSPPMTVVDYASTGRWTKGPKGRVPILNEEKVVCRWHEQKALRIGIFPVGILQPYTNTLFV